MRNSAREPAKREPPLEDMSPLYPPTRSVALDAWGSVIVTACVKMSEPSRKLARLDDEYVTAMWCHFESQAGMVPSTGVETPETARAAAELLIENNLGPIHARHTHVPE